MNFINVVHAASSITSSESSGVCKNIKMTSIGDIFNWASCTILQSIIPFLITLATAGFIYGIIKYFLNPDNEEQRKKGKSYMVWGIVGLFAMISVWGLVNVLSNTFHVKTLIPQLTQNPNK